MGRLCADILNLVTACLSLELVIKFKYFYNPNFVLICPYNLFIQYQDAISM